MKLRYFAMLFILIAIVIFGYQSATFGETISPQDVDEIGDFLHDYKLCKFWISEPVNYEGATELEEKANREIFYGMKIWCPGLTERLSALKERYIEDKKQMERLKGVTMNDDWKEGIPAKF